MKLSVSVPDELWQSAQKARPNLSVSHLVQTSLEMMIASSGTLGFPVTRPADADDAFEIARHRLANEARLRFESGYRAGLEASQKLPQWSIESLATTNRWDVEKWAQSFANSSVMVDLGRLPEEFRPEHEVIEALGTALGTFLSPYFEDTFTPDTAYLRGFSQSMRDLWTSVFEGIPAEGNISMTKSDSNE